MVKQAPDIWAIQSNPDELRNAMEQITANDNIFLYTNVISFFKFQKAEIPFRSFPTVLYSEKDNVMILLMKDCLINDNDLEQYLMNRKKQYAKISFRIPEVSYGREQQLPELWFANSTKVLEEALADTLDHISEGEMNRGCLYTAKGCRLTFKYPDNSTTTRRGHLQELFSIPISSVVALSDKIIFNTGFPADRFEQDRIIRDALKRHRVVYNYYSLQPNLTKYLRPQKNN